MNWPPSFLTIRIRGRRHGFGCWIPLLLIWPIPLLLGLVLAPLVLLASLLTWRTGYWRLVVFGGPALFRVLSALRGLRVDVHGRDGAFYLSLR